MTPHQLAWDHVEVGAAFTGFSLRLTFAKVALTPMATWDLFPSHHDPAYARAQGQPDIYLNTIALQGFADRLVTDWAGPHTFIARRKMTMVGSAFPGDLLSGSGTVVGKSDADGTGRVEVQALLTTETTVVCRIETTLVLPRR